MQNIEALSTLYFLALCFGNFYKTILKITKPSQWISILIEDNALHRCCKIGKY